MSPVENKEHKPGPIGKERSLKNRKARDAQQVEPGQEKPSPGTSRGTDAVATKDTEVASEMPTDLGTMISGPPAEYGADVKVSRTYGGRPCRCHQPCSWDAFAVDTAMPASLCLGRRILWMAYIWIIVSPEKILFPGVHM